MQYCFTTILLLQCLTWTLFYFQYIRPKRKCFYCGTFQSNLKKHLFRRHKGEDQIKEALKGTEHDQTRIVDYLLKAAIFDDNCHKEKSGDTITPIRQQGQTLKSENYVICGYCRGTYKKPQFWKHQRICYSKDITYKPKLKMSDLKLMENADNIPESSYFTQVLSKFADDEIGSLAKEDSLIREYGHRCWQKSTQTDRGHTSNSMRILANIVLEMRRLLKKGISASQMINPETFATLETAVANCYDKVPDTKIKLQGILKEVANVEKSIRIQKKSPDLNEVDNFLTLLNINSVYMFRESARIAARNRNIRLRAPASLPQETDVIQVRDYIQQEISQFEVRISEYDFECPQYNHFRDIVLAKLILFNARRGGEPTKLKLCEYEDSKKGRWTGQLQDMLIDAIDKCLFERYILAYDSGKGCRNLVPILIPNDVVQILDYMIQHREELGIHKENEYVFANGKLSLNPHRGWESVHKVVRDSGITNPANITATKMRHRASTYFSLLDLAPAEKDAFLKHMGHSADISANVYQCPPAFLEICRVGRFLEALEHGNLSLASTSRIQDIRISVPGNILY